MKAQTEGESLKKIQFKNADRKSVLFCLWACLATALYPAAYLYFANIKETALSDIAGTVGFSLLLMALLAVISLVFTRDFAKTSVAASVSYFIFINYQFMQAIATAIVPSVKYWHVVPIVIVMTVHLLYFMCKLLPKDLFKVLQVVFGAMFSVLIIVNLVTALPSIINGMRVSGAASADAETGSGDTPAMDAGEQEHPNIYFLLFDEYSNFSLLEKFYQYDNHEFKEFLEDNGFEISLDSYNECGTTHVVTTNNLNLAYVATSIQDYMQYRDHPYLLELLKEHGYDINYWSQIPIGWDGEEVERKAAQTVDGRSFWDVFIGRTIFGPFMNNDTGGEYIQLFYDEFDYLNEHIKLQDSNSFVYVHFDFPHLPFLFDQDGNYIGIQNRNNTEDGKYYLDQLIYTTKNIMKSVEKILEEDPNSIVILQSDHSMRYIGKPLGHGSLSTAADYTNIFNAVHFGGTEAVPIDGLSAVNTLRSVLNQVLGLDMEMLEVPFYG